MPKIATHVSHAGCKKKLIILLALVILITGAFLYVRFSLLKSKDFKPDTSKVKSILDLRPELIARLQQLVKDGSNGLYDLSIEKIELHISTGGVDMISVHIIPDSLAVSKLKSSHAAPPGVFKISIDSIISFFLVLYENNLYRCFKIYWLA